MCDIGPITPERIRHGAITGDSIATRAVGPEHFATGGTVTGPPTAPPPGDGLRRAVAQALETEWLRRAEQHLSGAPAEHCAALADAALGAVWPELERLLDAQQRIDFGGRPFAATPASKPTPKQPPPAVRRGARREVHPPAAPVRPEDRHRAGRQAQPDRPGR